MLDQIDLPISELSTLFYQLPTHRPAFHLPLLHYISPTFLNLLNSFLPLPSYSPCSHSSPNLFSTCYSIPRSFRHFRKQLRMDQDGGAVTLYSRTSITDPNKNSFSIKVKIAQMLRGGVILEVSNPEQAKIAEAAGACAVSITESNRMPDPSLLKEIKQSVSIPIMGKARIGHFVEAQILEAISVDYIDESESLAVADNEHFINKHNFNTPFVCGSRDLGEALRRVREGAAMIRTQGDLELSRLGNISDTVRNVRSVMGGIRKLSNMDDDEVFTFAKRIEAPYDIVAQTKQMGRLPVVHFASGGIVTPADVGLMMQLGCDGVFVGGEVFNCSDPYKKVRAIVQAVRHYNDPLVLAQSSSGYVDAMAALNLGEDSV